MSYELFRNELASKLLAVLKQDQVADVLSVFDRTANGYDIGRKPIDLIAVGNVPEAVKHYVAAKVIANSSPNTVVMYKDKLIKFFDTVRKPVTDISANDIREYLFAYKQNRKSSDSYLDNIRRTLNAFFEWCVANGYILRNPCASVERIKYQETPRTPFTGYELETMRWNCKNIRDKAIVDFFFSTGCRVSECVALNISDIDWEERSAVIRHGKGDKQRIVFFNAESEFSLRKYLESRTDDNVALFVTLDKPHARLQKRGIQDLIKRIGEKSELKAFPHKLRHTFATTGIRSGMPLEKLQMLMGHESPRTTLLYAKQDLTDLKLSHRRAYA